MGEEGVGGSGNILQETYGICLSLARLDFSPIFRAISSSVPGLRIQTTQGENELENSRCFEFYFYWSFDILT